MLKIRKEWLEEMMRTGRAHTGEVKSMAAMLLEKWAPDPGDEDLNEEMMVFRVPRELVRVGPDDSMAMNRMSLGESRFVSFRLSVTRRINCIVIRVT